MYKESLVRSVDSVHCAAMRATLQDLLLFSAHSTAPIIMKYEPSNIHITYNCRRTYSTF